MVSFPIRTPDYRLRVFVSSTLGELSDERAAVRSAIEQLHLAPVMFELGARPHPPRSLYRAYLDQSHVFVGIYWQRYGWVAPGESISGLEDEYRLAGDRPRLLYIKQPAPEREERLADLTKEFQADDRASYKRFATVDELSALVVSDLALLLSERFEATLESSTRPVPFWTAYSEGIYFVPLETVTEDKLLERSIVDRLGIPVEGAWSAREALVAYFSGRRALLILDNVEQIVNVERPLRELLERIPGITLLVTSRRSLGIAGAHEIDVSPLPTPEPSTPKGTLAALPAVRLFLDRARDVGARFETEDDALQAVAEICRRVDGLPLAIELAAARTRLLPPTSLLSRLNEGLDLLHRRAPDVPERQQTLRATLAWSYKLLEEQPRALLARLSVFAGSFSLEAAEQVCDPNGSMEFVDSLTSLLDNSLVLAAEDPSFSEPRFRMLETVRTFAAEQLDQTPEADVAFRGHLAWYRELSHQAHPFLCGPNQKDWAVRMDAERANVRKAVTTALNLGDLAGIVELAWDLAVFYEIRDASQEPGEWLREVIERNPDFDDLMRAKLVSLDALFRAQAGDFTGAADSLNWSLSEFRRHGLDFYCAVTLMVLAGVYYSQDGDTPRAVEMRLAQRMLWSAHLRIPD
jgi:predicted ATPase